MKWSPKALKYATILENYYETQRNWHHFFLEMIEIKIYEIRNTHFQAHKTMIDWWYHTYVVTKVFFENSFRLYNLRKFTASWFQLIICLINTHKCVVLENFNGIIIKNNIFNMNTILLTQHNNYSFN